MSKRFKVALSFPGEHRTYIEQVANHLAYQYGRGNILYDKYHSAEFARPNLDVLLPELYKNESELVVYFLCEDYANKEWCGLEWRIIREMIKQKKDESLMQFKFDNYPVPGDLTIDGYIEIGTLSPKEVSDYIIERVNLSDLEINKKNSINSENGIALLKKMEITLMELKEGQQNSITKLEIENLTKEKEELRLLLLQKNDIIEQLKNSREELEKLLTADQHEIKKLALVAVEKQDYNSAEVLLKQSVEEKNQNIADDYYQLGIVKALQLEYIASLEYHELAAKTSPRCTEYLLKAGQLCLVLSRLDKALFYYEQALHIETDSQPVNYQNLIFINNELGGLWLEKANYAKAKEIWEEALKTNLELFGETGFIATTLYNNLGSLYSKMGDINSGILYLEKALHTDIQINGEEHPNVSITYNTLGLAWQDTGNFNKAKDYIQRALTIDIKLFGEHHPKISIRYNNLALILQHEGNWDKAAEYYEKALKINSRVFGSDSHEVAICYNNLSGLLSKKRQHNTAISYVEKALQINLHLFGEEHPDTISNYNNLGSLWFDKGNYPKAIEYGEKAYALALKMFGATHQYTEVSKRNLDGYMAA